MITHCKIYNTYGIFYLLGKSFCSVKEVEVEEPKDFTESIAEKLKIEYTLKAIKKAKLKYFSYA